MELDILMNVLENETSNNSFLQEKIKEVQSELETLPKLIAEIKLQTKF